MTSETAEQLRPAYEALKAESLAIAAELKGVRSACDGVEQTTGGQIGAIRTRVDDIEHRMRSLNSSILHFYDALETADPIPKGGRPPRKEGKT